MLVIHTINSSLAALVTRFCFGFFLIPYSLEVSLHPWTVSPIVLTCAIVVVGATGLVTPISSNVIAHDGADLPESKPRHLSR